MLPEPVVTPIYLTAGFAERDRSDGDDHHWRYTRYGNPTVADLERRLAQLEGAEEGVAFASGMGAIHAVLTTLLGRATPAVLSRHLYPGTENLAAALADKGLLTTRYVDPDRPAEVREALDGAGLLWLDSPSNPTLHVADVAGLATLAAEAGVPV